MQQDTYDRDFAKETHRPPGARTYWLTRFVILRLLGLVYAVAFLVLINEAIPLIGHHGLTPADLYLDEVTHALGSPVAGFLRLPSLFWMFHSDTALLAAAWAGLVISCVVLAGYANAILLAVLWILYLSFVHIGQEWYGYGWEIQLTETGFLAIFLCPLLDGQPFSRRPPPLPIIVLFRWLIFRIMLGSALIKLRWDVAWKNGTALYYHFQSQPIPGPLSRWFHFLPRSVLKAGVWFNFLAELIAPLFAFWPRIGRILAGIVMIAFQLAIILSGNLSFLNWLTIIPALACFDDDFLRRLLPRSLVRKAEQARRDAVPARPMVITAWVATIVICLLSIQPALNLLSPGQVMNTSFDPLELVNTYGAFGTVGRERLNVVFEGTRDSNPDSASWKEYIYRGLPVLLDRRPPQVAPYQLHLDWQMWFASMESPDEYPWTFNLEWKLLHNDPATLSLLANNPFPGDPPRYVRAVLYVYSFAPPGNPGRLWWTRVRKGLWLPPVSVKDSGFVMYLKSQGWVR